MQVKLLHTIAFSLLGCCYGVAQADEKGKPAPVTARGIVVEEIQNANPQFSVRVAVDRKDRTYLEKEVAQVTVESSRAGYLYLIYCDAGGDAYVLFPNKFQQSNKIAANQQIVVPAENANFLLRIRPPFGTEVLKAIVTTNPIKSNLLPSLTKDAVTKLDVPTLRTAIKGMTVEERPAVETTPATTANTTSLPPKQDFAEHSIKITTLPANSKRELEKPRRFAVLVGISQFADPKIRDLSVCHRDAEAMKKILLEKCGVEKENCIMLLNSDATLANVKKVLSEDGLPKLTKPGDIVFIYWSGHGGRCADEGGDEQDGYDEYLPLHDSTLFKMETMLLDDTFGRWVQDLDGRKIVVVLDACYSAGQLATAKSIDGAPDADKASEMDWMPFDFGGNELSRVKDIGQDDAAIIASSASQDVSHERVEGDLSVMTYYLVETLNKATTPVMLEDLVETITPAVGKYIEAYFPGAKQSVYFQNDMVEPLQVTR